MIKTLLLVFIHGFKGGDDTFGTFPEHLRALVSHALPSIKVVATTYPKYETRGDLKECVGRLREWLQNKVIDIEVENQTPSPTVDPSVHVFLIGHSMGGIVGAETILLLASEQPISGPASTVTTAADAEQPSIVEQGNFMFPHVQGLLAFDTPFLGIAPGVVSYGAEGHYKTATTAYTAFSEVAGVFGYGSNSTPSSATHSSTPPSKGPAKALPAAPVSSDDVAEPPSWQRWGRYAMFAGAAGAVAAGGAAALYSQRQRLTDGLSWVSSHLEFVGCLARTADLHQRLARLAETQRERDIRSINFYTCLGKGAPSLVENSSNPGKTTSFSQKIIRSKNRTFCFLPPEIDEADGAHTAAEQAGLRWRRAMNDKATDEVKAHISMFFPLENPAFYVLAHEACEALVNAVDKGWYDSASEPLRGGALNGNPSQPAHGHGPVNVESDNVIVID